ncbi:MAG: helix-turn-helix domain-containing protein [Candidatus Rokuibacteriota bacterium]
MRYRGRLRHRTGGQRAPHHFFCPVHTTLYRFVSDDGGEIAVTLHRGARPSKVFPWGSHPACPSCGEALTSSGEWKDRQGRRLFRLICRGRHAGRKFYYAEDGTVVHRPIIVARRVAPVTSPAPADAPLCPACQQRPVEKHRCCAECSQQPVKAYRERRRRANPSAYRLEATLMAKGGLRRLRRRAGWTQKNLAERSGLSERTIKLYESTQLPRSPTTKRPIRAVGAP